MIGKIIIGKSFRGCIGYCLDKKEAELLNANLCYGNKNELIDQFNEVRRLNQNLSKPVQHITISLAKGEHLNKEKLISIADDCAKDLGFEKNQYIVIAHGDTGHQHIHIVVNRVGFDGKTVKDSHNYQKIAAYCRRMEEKHRLQKVLSPRRYLAKEQRQLPRIDQRREKLRQDIKECLAVSKNYSQFELQMKMRGYKVEKARGIAFIDIQKVRVKGSEVGYSLSKIERVLSLQPQQKKAVLQQEGEKEMGKTKIQQQQFSIIQPKDLQKDRSVRDAAELLIKPAPFQENIIPALLKKKKQRKRRLHL
jgi:hypothetical protein